MKEPTVNVPVSTFLELVRFYELQPQEEVSRKAYLNAKYLERRAYRKWLEHRKKNPDEENT